MNNSFSHHCEPEFISPSLSNAVTRWVAALIGLAMLCLSASSGNGADTIKEYELKAAFLYNFNKFIEWPVNSFRDPNAPFVVAVAGSSPCTAELERIAKDRKVNGRSLVIKIVQTPAAARGAQILFVPAAEDSRLKYWLAAAHGAGVLTIGESEPFFKQGGIINFVLEGDKIRFDVNIGQADAAGLKVSAQLQKVARTVRKKS